jgi:hypothetical protein
MGVAGARHLERRADLICAGAICVTRLAARDRDIAERHAGFRRDQFLDRRAGLAAVERRRGRGDGCQRRGDRRQNECQRAQPPTMPGHRDPVERRFGRDRGGL